MASPHVLVRRPTAADTARVWEPQAQRVLDGLNGFVRVLGGPGTGKTTLIADAAAQRIVQGGGNVLVLAATRRAAEGLRVEIARRVTAGSGEAGQPRTVREPLVRTVHSYAFGVLRAQANNAGAPPPRLLSGPEQDTVVRELLAGDAAEDAATWPDALRPALTVPGFAEELRDLLMRAAERGLGPQDLVRLGKRKRRPAWVAAGRFWQQYEEVTVLANAGGSALAAPPSTAYDAAELVGSALICLQDDADLLLSEQNRVRHLFVDDMQHLDPLQWRLLRLIGDAAREFVVTGDTDQAVYAFRGADPQLLADADHGTTVTLRNGHRMTPAVRNAVATVGSGMARPPSVPVAVTGEDDGTVTVRTFSQPAAEATWIANQLRRAHLIDGVAWESMAVLMRSPTRSLGTLQRALRAAGVPMASVADEVPLARNAAIRPLLLAMRVAAGAEDVDPDIAEALLSSPLGGVDPLSLRQVRRGLRRLEQAAGGDRGSDELLADALRDGDQLTGLAEAEAAPLRRISRVLAAGRDALGRGAGVEDVLWEMWSASGLQQRWLRASERGGAVGRRADADLDAVVALFHAASSYVDRLPNESVAGFADYLLSQRIVGDTLAPSSTKSAGVELLTAHGAAGREWDVVAIAAAQEGSWPDLRPRGSLLGVERLVDLMRGVDADTSSATAPLLADERRLFYVAASRARRKLLVSACEGEDELPSRFVREVEEAATAPTTDGPAGKGERPLVLADLVGELRTALCAPDGDPDRKRRAARQLAKLAAAGVPGAHPDTWYGLAGPSTDAPVFDPGETITVSPSTVDVLDRCSLRWLLAKHGGEDPAPLAAVTGTMVHGLAQAAAEGANADELRNALEEAWRKVDVGAPWYDRRELARVERMIEAFSSWLRMSRQRLTEVAVEADIEVELPPADDGEHRIRLKGRVDRLERDDQGRYVVVDIKTGKTPVSKNDGLQHPQLAAYQLAVSVQGETPGGGELLFIAATDAKGVPKTRAQDPLDDDARQEWLERIRAAAESSAGPLYLATETPDCDRCPGRRCCPLQIEGRQVTS